MDLAEVRDRQGERHPWEQSRARALERVIRTAGVARAGSILDYGCGDAYTGRSLRDSLGAERLLGVDLHLTDAQCASLRKEDARLELTNRIDAIGDGRFDLVLLCDVIEHVEDDVALLSVAREHTAPGGHVVVTVPAFQALFTEHDRWLKHFRRYSLGQLEASVRSAGLSVVSSGYLFGSLVFTRGVGKLLELLRGARSTEPEGLGDWKAGATLTKIITEALSAENSLLLGLAERGIKLPGLSAWALCR